VTDDPSSVIRISDVDIVFGRPKDTKAALELLDAGMDRELILSNTNAVIGVAGMNLTVYSGEVCVLMGRSGSGKSTILRAINGLNRTTRGSILVRYNGQMINVTRCNQMVMKKLRQRHVAMVFQQVALFPWRTVRENVGFGLEIAGVSADKRQKIVDEKLELVGLSGWGDKLATELSGGMQQRVGLSRALATDADILLMDEPFSSLDPLMRSKLQDELLELQSKLHKTVLFVSHDLDEALKIGSHIAVMEGGRISQYGTPEEVVISPANDYIRDFVAHVNPLSVLSAYNVMRDVRDLKPAGEGWRWLEDSQDTRLKLDVEGRVVACESHGKPVETISCDAWGRTDVASCNLIFLANVDLPLRCVVMFMHCNPASVGVVDENNRLVGAIGVRDIMRSVLGR